MKTFDVTHKLRYGEAEDTGAQRVKGNNKREAIRKFLRKQDHDGYHKSISESIMWQEGVWTAFLKNITEVTA